MSLTHIVLRPRQRQMVDLAKQALLEKGDTLCVAPTGAGKTIMLSTIVKECLDLSQKALILQHTDEIFQQNKKKFQTIDHQRQLSDVNALHKDFSGQVIFAMVQSLHKSQTLQEMPLIDLLVIDEAHHAVAPTYEKIINHTRQLNPNLKILGMTATPTRTDRHALGQIFSNVADQISIEELVASGDLLYPKTFVIDTEARDKVKNALQKVQWQDNFEHDLEEAEEAIEDIDLKDVILHWKEKAKGRKTVIFCNRIQHSKEIAKAFRKAGIKAKHIDGTFSLKEREDILSQFTKGKVNVLSNVAVLTEGWDDPPTSCIILLRALLSHPTMIQMIGRGLRVIDPFVYPNVQKKDCIVLDFGMSVSRHGSIESKVDLLPKKKCSHCKTFIPVIAHICPSCGADLMRKQREREERERIKEERQQQRIKDFEMREFLLQKAREQREEIERQNHQELEEQRNKDLEEYSSQQESYRENLKNFRAAWEKYIERCPHMINADRSIEQYKNNLKHKNDSSYIIFTPVQEKIWLAGGSVSQALIIEINKEKDAYGLFLLQNSFLRFILCSQEIAVLCAESFLRQERQQFLPFSHEAWLEYEPTSAQLNALYPLIPSNRREGAAWISYKFNQNRIRAITEKMTNEMNEWAEKPENFPQSVKA